MFLFVCIWSSLSKIKNNNHICINNKNKTIHAWHDLTSLNIKTQEK